MNDCKQLTIMAGDDSLPLVVPTIEKLYNPMRIMCEGTWCSPGSR